MSWLQWDELKEAELGHTFEIDALQETCKVVCGGVSWPGKRPGFAVVLAMNGFGHFDSYDICLLDEYESFDIRSLVRQCGVLDYKYKPEYWIGDRHNDAADSFIDEMNREFKLPEESQKKRKPFCLFSTPLLDMNCLYQHILASLKNLLDKERRQLFLKDSAVVNYLGSIEPAEIVALELGDYPAIEALAFAVIEMRDRSHKPTWTKEQIRLWQEKNKGPWAC